MGKYAGSRVEGGVAGVFRDPQVNYYVRDVEASVRFYTDLFGFAETFRTPSSGPPDHVELRLGGLILGFASIESAKSMHGLTTGTGSPKAEVCLWTDDVDRVYSSLVARGVQSLSSPHDFLGRLRAAWVADPDGNPIEIVAEHTSASQS
jgi:catechol 2,3-dioxygenase-like lactoylglutathione lyase family enzyme